MKATNELYLQKAILTSFLLISISLPFSIKLNSITIILSSVLVLANFFWKRGVFKLQHRNLAIASISLFLLHVLSVAYSSDTKEGWFEVEKKLSLLVFPLILLSRNMLSKSWTKTILVGFALSSMLFLSIHLVKLYYHDPLERQFFVEENGFNLRRAFDMYYQIHPTYLSLYLAFSASIFTAYFRITTSLVEKVFNCMASIVCLGFVVALGSRIIIVSMMCLLLAYIISNLSKKRVIEGIGVMLLIAIGTVFAYQLTPSVKNRFNEVISTKSYPPLTKEEMNSTNIRIAVWQCTKEIIASQNLIWGIGIGDVQHTMDGCFQGHKWAKELYESKYNVHNQFLQTLIGVGGIGLILLLYIYFYSICEAVRNKKPLLLALMVFIGLASCTETVLGTQKGTVFYFFMLFLLLISDSPQKTLPIFKEK